MDDLELSALARGERLPVFMLRDEETYGQITDLPARHTVSIKQYDKTRITGRTTFVETSMLTAAVIAMRGTCIDRAVGCVLTKGNVVVASGYNGAVAGAAHCQDVGCLHDVNGRCIRCVHAEVNACLVAGKGMADTAYCTLYPCLKCLQTMLQCGIATIWYWQHRDDVDVVAFCTDMFGNQYEAGSRPWPLRQVPTEVMPLLESVSGEIRGYTRLRKDV